MKKTPKKGKPTAPKKTAKAVNHRSRKKPQPAEPEAAKEPVPKPEEKKEEEIPFSLLVENRVVAEPRLKLGWRLPPEIAERIKHGRGLKNAYVLMSIIDIEKSREIDRVAVPLLQGMDVVDYHFDRPGKFRILATILYSPLLGEGYGEGGFFKSWLEKDGPLVYRHDLAVVSRDGKWDIDFRTLRACSNGGEVIGRAELELQVAPEFFAKELPAWLRQWVDGDYAWPSRNSCEFRRRALFWAFSFKFVFFAIWAIGYGLWTVIKAAAFLVFLSLGVMLGKRNLNWRAVLHPHAESKVGWGPSIYTTGAHGEKRPRVLLAFSPACLLLVFFAALAVWLVPVLYVRIFGETLKTFTQVFVRFFLVPIVCLACLDILGKAVKMFLPSVSRRFYLFKGRRFDRMRARNRARERRKAEAHNVAQARQELSLNLLVNRPNVVSIELVPEEQRSLLLRWINFKAQVCRPFANRH